MSISTDPSLYDYSVAPNICNACFAIGETPKKIILCLSGIELGADWAPPDPPPPNGLHLIDVSAPCAWDLNDGAFLFFWVPFGPLRTIEIKLVTNEPVFHATSFGTCKDQYDNDLLVPLNNHYHSGSALLLPPLAGGAISLPEVMELLSEDPVWAKWANPQPIDDVQTVHKFYDRDTSTNIKILYEP